MGPSDLLAFAAGILDRLGIEYLVTGSMASIVYGEPRFTNDVDIAVLATPEQAARLAEAFPEPDFYASPDAARVAAARHAQFNVIHPASGLKIDFMTPKDDAFNRSRFARGREVPVTPGSSAMYASPEDVIIRKLQYFMLGGSDKHLRDIRGILKTSSGHIDLEYIAAWASREGVAEVWCRVRDADRGSG